MDEIKFRKTNLDDYDALKTFFALNRVEACDYSTVSLLFWPIVYNSEICIDEETLFIRYLVDGEYYYCFPFTKGSVKKAIDKIKKYCEDNGENLKMGVIEEDMYEVIKKLYPDNTQICYDRDREDYIYEVEKLIKLSGKKYHGKKNHVNKFKKNYKNWNYEPISRDNLSECINMVREWCISNKDEDGEIENEVQVMINALNNMERFGYIGGAIRVSDKIIAVTLGEKLNQDTFVTHFEKADTSYDGAYSIINQQFAMHELKDYVYVNREEDLGYEGLRKAKESYHPYKLVKKGTVSFNE